MIAVINNRLYFGYEEPDETAELHGYNYNEHAYYATDQHNDVFLDVNGCGFSLQKLYIDDPEGKKGKYIFTKNEYCVILCLETGAIYDNYADMSKRLNIDKHTAQKIMTFPQVSDAKNHYVYIPVCRHRNNRKTGKREFDETWTEINHISDDFEAVCCRDKYGYRFHFSKLDFDAVEYYHNGTYKRSIKQGYIAMRESTTYLWKLSRYCYKRYNVKESKMSIKIDTKEYFAYRCELIERNNEYDFDKHVFKSTKNNCDLYLDENLAGFRLSKLYIVSDTLGRWYGQEGRYRAVLCHETGDVFNDLDAVARAFAGSHDGIKKHMSRQRVSFKGRHFSYITVIRDKNQLNDLDSEWVDIEHISKTACIARYHARNYKLWFDRHALAEELGIGTEELRLKVNNARRVEGTIVDSENAVIRIDKYFGTHPIVGSEY